MSICAGDIPCNCPRCKLSAALRELEPRRELLLAAARKAEEEAKDDAES